MLTWNLPQSPESIRDRLVEVVDNVGVPFPFVFANGPAALIDALTDYKPGARRVLGTVTRFDFRLLLRTDRPSVFSTICSGSIRSRPGGCEVRARFQFHGAVVFFFWVVVLWSLTIVLLLASAEAYPSNDWWLTRVGGSSAILLLSGSLLWYAWTRRRIEEVHLTRLLTQVLGPAQSDAVEFGQTAA